MDSFGLEGKNLGQHEDHEDLIGIDVAMPKKNSVSEEEWTRQVKLFELGHKHASQIAADLGVSPQTVGREMQKREAIKGSLLHRHVAVLERQLDAMAEHRAHMDLVEARRQIETTNGTMAALASMMGALVHAEKSGSLSLADPIIAGTAALMGVRLAKKKARS